MYRRLPSSLPAGASHEAQAAPLSPSAAPWRLLRETLFESSSAAFARALPDSLQFGRVTTDTKQIASLMIESSPAK